MFKKKGAESLELIRLELFMENARRENEFRKAIFKLELKMIEINSKVKQQGSN